MPTGSHTDSTAHHGWGWLDNTDPIPLTDRREPGRDSHLDATPAESPATTEPAEAGTGGGWAQRLPTPAWIALVVSLLVSVAVIGVGVLTLRGQTTAPPQLPTVTAAPPPSSSVPPSTTRVRPEACAGLTGDIVTDSAGDPSSVTGVIAAFEHAYYTARDAEAALRLTVPEAGLDPHILAGGIASIPAGTRHCVAITTLADTAADVHLVEKRPDGQRRDYLQVINARRDGDRMLITNIQKRG